MLVSIEKTYQTLKTVFDHISKHLELRQKYSAARRIFNSLLGVWKCGQTRSFLFDILLLNTLRRSLWSNKKKYVIVLKFNFAFQGGSCSDSWRHAWWDRCSWTEETAPLLCLQCLGSSYILYTNRAEVLRWISFLWKSSKGWFIPVSQSVCHWQFFFKIIFSQVFLKFNLVIVILNLIVWLSRYALNVMHLSV